MVFLNDIQANKININNSTNLPRESHLDLTDKPHDTKDANNNNSTNLNRQENKNKEEQRFVSTIVLPSQYIDLSSYLYSPLRSIRRELVSQQQLQHQPIVIGSTGKSFEADKGVLSTDITSATARFDNRIVPQLLNSASHHIVSSTPDTVFKRNLRKEALNRIASTINTSSPNSSSDNSSLETNSLTSSLTSSTISSSLISSISSNNSDDMIMVNSNNTNNIATNNSTNLNFLNNPASYIMSNTSSTSTSPIVLNAYQVGNNVNNNNHNNPNNNGFTTPSSEMISTYNFVQTNNPNNNIPSHNVNNSSTDEHEELLAEMELIERLPTQERLKQAKRRRALQLKKWSEYERELESTQKNKKKHHTNNESVSKSSIHANKRFTQPTRIKFQDHVVLLEAIMRKDYDEVEHLLKSGISANSANEDGLTAIHQCCIDDSADLLKILIKYGANVNVVDNDLWTPLHAAATCANLEICKILIENDADLLAVNTDGNMPYDICDDELCLEYIESEMASRGVTQQTIDMKRSETEIKMLEDLKQTCFKQINSIKKQTVNRNDLNITYNLANHFNNMIRVDGQLDLNACDANGATLMHIACANGYNTVLEFLLNDCKAAAENGAPIILASLHIKDNDGWTPLHVATFWGHQRAIELLLEHGADINQRTNNDETVLELCDDQDIRDFIIQKSKEIEAQQQQKQAQAAAAAARAALKLKMQMLSNNTSNNSSINSIRSSTADKMQNSMNNINNSSRSLKRSSTGVSRSSSVRRSSFRDKEKASRKLDASFKDALYASENQDDLKESNSEMNNSDTTLNTSNDQLINRNNNNNNNNNLNSKQPFPLVINHLKESNDNNKKLTTVVKVIKSNGHSESSKPIQTPKIDGHNLDDNNNKNEMNNHFQSASSSVNLNKMGPIARIHSNGSVLQSTNPIVTTSNSAAFNSNLTTSTNYSMTSSALSDSSLPVNQTGTSNSILPVNNLSLNSANTVSTASITIIDVNSSNKQMYSTLNTQTDGPKGKKEPILNYADLKYTKINQPTLASNKAQPQIDMLSQQDGVKYKFVSNETIGANKMSNEYDIENTHKFKFCFKCFRCCSFF